MISSTPLNRSAARLVLLVAEERVETNHRYVPHNGLTYCNSFAAAVCARMGCPIPNKLANDLHEWFSSHLAQALGWESSTAEEAQRLADQGAQAVASWRNQGVDEHGAPRHGHIAIVMPSLGEPGIWVAAAGANNATRTLLERQFGKRVPDFFVHA
jgi:hypothetical protein